MTTNISVYLTILASVLFFGYSLSLSTNGYRTICEKAVKFREMLSMEIDAFEGIRKTNIMLISVFSIIYLSLLYLSGYVYWFIGFVLFKLALTLFFSDLFQRAVINNKVISKRLYMFMKVDSILNSFLGLFTPLLIIL